MTLIERPVPRVDQPSISTVLLALVGLPLLLAMPFIVGRPEELGGVLVAVTLTGAVTAVIVLRLARLEHDRTVSEMLKAAVVVKLCGMAVRYYLSFESFRADAQLYHLEGARLAESYRDFEFGAEIGRSFVGTGFIRVFTGVIYSVTGPSRLAGTVVFSAFALWGALLMYRAFCIGVPDGDRKRYALLLLFLPSMLFWPSIIGKESWMLFGLGLSALGVAKILRHQPVGWIWLASGLVATGVVRPHLTVMVFAGAAAAWLLRREQKTAIVPVQRVLGLVVFLIIGALIAGQLQTFFGIDDLSSDSIDEALSSTEDQSGQGGSQFEPVRVRTPLDFPAAAVTVLFRPFPNEANGLTAMIAAAESMLLLAVVLLSWRRLRSLPRQLFTSPYLAMALVFAVTFVFAFAAIGNFGILARQRTQALPFLLVLLSVRVPATDSDRPGPGWQLR